MAVNKFVKKSVRILSDFEIEYPRQEGSNFWVAEVNKKNEKNEENEKNDNGDGIDKSEDDFEKIIISGNFNRFFRQKSIASL